MVGRVYKAPLQSGMYRALVRSRVRTILESTGDRTPQ